MNVVSTQTRGVGEMNSAAALVVLGMHRSGTSAITGALRLCGAWTGDETELTAPNAENPHGFWERRDVRRICDRLLHTAEADWWKVASFDLSSIPHTILTEQRNEFARVVSALDEREAWVIKEPRLCLLLPVLRDHIANPFCIHIFRNPLEVARSLQRRNGFGIAAGIALWEAYNRHALRVARDLPRVLVSHESLMRHPVETLDELLRQLDRFGVSNLTQPDADELKRFISPSLYRSRATEAETLEYLAASQLALWHQLRSNRLDDHVGGVLDSGVTKQYLFDLESTERSLNQHRDRIAGLTGELGRRDKVARERDATIKGRDATIRERDATIRERDATIRERDATIKGRAATIRERDATVQERDATIKERDATIGERDEMLRRFEKRTRALTRAHDRKIKRLEIRASELRSRLLIRDATIRELFESNSWRVTAPLRSLSRGAGWTRRKTRQALRLLFWIGTGQFSRASAAMRTDIHEVVNLARQGRDAPPDPRAAYVSELVAKCRKNNERMAAAIDAQHAGGQKPRTSISVIAWDVAHNPLGRAYLLADALRKEYDVELIGATFPRFGNEIWEPLRTGSRVTIKSFPGDNFPGHFQSMEDIAKQIEGDVILVSKPRLPSLELAILAKMHRNRPIILDVDDYELGFFGNRKPLTLAEIRAGGRQLNTDCPHDEVWTRYSESLIPLFEQITVSNEELQRKYGGMVLPHIRDAHDFDPAIYPREEIRAGLGFSSEDRVILFAGTPRAHKGYERTIAALNKLNRGNYKFLLVGSPMDRVSRRFIENIDDNNITILPNVAFRDLPGYLCASDLICLLQDESDVASHFQMPAKFTDALSMGIPLLATNVPPLVNVANEGLVELLHDVPLEERIDGIFGDYETHKRAAVRNRKAFLEKYSYTAVVPRVKEVIDRFLRNPAPIPDEFRELLSYHRELYSNERGPPRTTLTVVGANRPDPADWPADATTANSMVFFRGRKDRSYVDEKLDIVFFWKQNDSGIYGRRQDMLVKYLAMETRVHRIFHFDAPMNILRSGGTATRTGGVSRHSHARFVLLNTLRRRYFRGRWAKVRRDTYTFLVGRRAPGFIKRFLPSEDGYLQYLENVFRRHAVGERAVVFWVCPNDFHFPEIERRFRPDLIVADVIDDQRKWDISDRYEKKLHHNYREILGRSHLVFANCHSVLRSMGEFSGNVHLLPNAAEFLEKEWGSWKKPPELVRMNGPIVGYVGNLDVTRIDVDLLVAVAKARPDWNLVLIGSMHRGREIRRLDEFRNVHFLGVRMYDKAIRYIRHFDVAMIPHLDNKLTRSMNPLKLYVYFALHIPVVATPISNIEDFSEFVKIGRTPEEFINEILSFVDNDPTSRDHARLRELLEVNSWRKRVDRILELMDIEFLNRDREVPAVIGKPASRHADAGRVQ